jgi:hypothetical protein
MSRSQFNYRIPAHELEELKEEARRHGISVSALNRINNKVAREVRKREELRLKMYPDKGPLV